MRERLRRSWRPPRLSPSRSTACGRCVALVLDVRGLLRGHDIRYLRNITVNVDGRGHLFDGGAVQMIHPQRGPVDDDDGYLLIYESDIAAIFAGFLSLSARSTVPGAILAPLTWA